ncbi:SdpI/YhfL family protein [Pseudonocardia endophytica]|uniref:SdpI/YhfL family protein n=1 Tax=Pseudonocardia endophytica TaxID=401976 RepID=A0A4R1IB85_PSEEN|nr:SdpI/YhfL family protein [Pseudonocardia endophytica]
MLAGVLVLAGLVLVVVATLGATSRLPRNRFAGVRTRASLRSGAAFAAANRVAAPPAGAAGVIALVGGVALAATPGSVLAWVFVAVSVIGTVLLAGVGGVVGDRAAAAVQPEPAPTCGGTCAGCDLVAGCGPGRTVDEGTVTSPSSPGRP